MPSRPGAVVCSSALAFVLLAPSIARAVGTPAGVDITNRATASYTVGGTPVSQDSNDVVVTVLELIDVDVTSQDAGAVSVTTPDPGGVLTFLVTNIGNGSEDFALAVTNGSTPPDDFDPTSFQIYLDTDGTPGLNTATDTLYTGPTDVRLDANAVDQLTAFVVGVIPGGQANGDTADVTLTATSDNHPGGAPAPGTALPGAGDGGIDAVLGAGSGEGSDAGQYVVADVSVSVVKSVAAIADPFGGTQPVPGSVITYTIVVSVAGASTATGVTITDPIPPNTSYEPTSMTLDDGAGGGPAGLSDIADADAGEFVAGPPAEIRVTLGDMPPGSPAQTITFQVSIN